MDNNIENKELTQLEVKKIAEHNDRFFYHLNKHFLSYDFKFQVVNMKEKTNFIEIIFLKNNKKVFSIAYQNHEYTRHRLLEEIKKVRDEANKKYEFVLNFNQLNKFISKLELLPNKIITE
jgi:hypothetical protein